MPNATETLKFPFTKIEKTGGTREQVAGVKSDNMTFEKFIRYSR